MCKIGVLVAALLLVHTSYVYPSFISDHLTGGDLDRLKTVFQNSLQSLDIQSVFYGVLNQNVTNLSPDLKRSTCEHITKLHADSKLNDFEKHFYLASTYKQLLCHQLIPDNVQNSVSLKKEFSSTQELYYTFFTLKSFGSPIKEQEKYDLVKNIQGILKKDDSIVSLAYGFHVAAELGTAAMPIAEWIEGSFAQADEIDNTLMQFEGGLSVTGLLLSGAFKLTTSLKKPAPITKDVAIKFGTYLLTRRSVQTSKGASILLEALNTISRDENVSPMCVKLVGNGQIHLETEAIHVKVVDLLGYPVSPVLDSVSAVIKRGLTIVVPKTNLVSRSSDKTVFSLNISPSNLSRDSYNIEVYVNSLVKTLSIRLLGRVKVENMEIGIGEVDSTSNIKKTVIAFKQKLAEVLNADAQQKLFLRAELVDELSGEQLNVHQAFVRLVHLSSQMEIIFVAEQDYSKAYKFDMDIGARSFDFGYRSGIYSIEFIVGDFLLSNSFSWIIADINLKFPQHPNAPDLHRSVRPEIVHRFRVPEKRPSRVVSDLFTALCVTPLLILFYLWSKLGLNVSNFKFGLSAIVFHLGFGSILTLFAIFFWKLNMFETIRYLLPLALITFFFGNRLLRSIANEKK